MPTDVATQAIAYHMEKVAAALEPLTFRQTLDLGLQLGVPAQNLLGVDSCDMHPDARDMHPHEALTFDGTSRWCKVCWKWKRLP